MEAAPSSIVQGLNNTPPPPAVPTYFYVDKQLHRHVFQSIFQHPTIPRFVCGYTTRGVLLTVHINDLQTIEPNGLT